MPEHDDPRVGAALFDFVQLLLRDREAGRAHPLEHYQAFWPDHAGAIAGEWAAMHAHAEPAQSYGQVGPWRLVRELGRGGQGSVWLAEDTRIARRAALKLLEETFATYSLDRRARLRREAETLARLDHPGLCPILEADVEGERPYLAMRLIEGLSLAAHLAAGPQPGGVPPLAPRTRAELDACLLFFEEAARALHVAHEAGVVHRDVKPGNVMVTPAGRPVLVDFGQAREASGADALTMSGEVFGTPSYMSPEQVRGRSREVDRRTDVWALGATLYECLTLRRPFEGASLAATMLAIERGPLPPPREHNPALPREVVVLLETALERDPARRYARALDLAEDLARVRRREPIRARPAGARLRLRRWAQRQPALAAGLSAVIGGLAVGWLWTAHLLAREQRANTWALGSHLAKRAQALIAEDPAAALALGIEAVQKAPNYETRAALLAALDACDLRSNLAGSPGRRFFDLDLDPAGERVAGALDDGALRVYDLRDGERLQEFALDDAPLRAVRFVANGTACVAGGDGGTLHLVPLDGGAARALPGPGGALLDLAPAPDGTRVAVCPAQAAPYVVDALDGRTLFALDAPAGEFDALAWAPDGARILCFTRPRAQEERPATTSALLVDAEDGARVARLAGHSAAIVFATFDARGERVATVGLDGRALLHGAADGAALGGPPRASGARLAAAFSPDGTLLACAGEAGEAVTLWDTRSGTLAQLAEVPAARVQHLAFSPDGALLACAGEDNATRLHDVASGARVARFSGYIQPVESLWTPDGRSLVSLGRGNTVSVWIAGGRDDVYTLAGHTAALTDAELSRDGTRALTASLDGSARLWCTARGGAERAGRCVAVLAAGSGAVRGARFGSGDELAWTWGDAPAVGLWDGRDGGARGTLGPLDARVLDLDVSAQSPSAAAITASGALVLLDGRELAAREAPLGRGFTCLRFAPDGRLALGRADGDLLVLDARGTLERTIEAPPDGLPPAAIAFAPSGLELAWIDTGGRVRFARLDGAPARAELVTFAPLDLEWSGDGARLLAVGSRGRGAFRLVDLAGGNQVRLEAFHAGDLTGGEFSPDGALVLSSSADGTVYVRRAADGVPEALLTGHRAAVTRARFSRDGGALRVISASADGTARVTPVDPLPPALARKPRDLQEWEVHRERRLAEPLEYVR
jgi:WD40 repeat protein